MQVAACHLSAAAGGHNTIPFVLIQGPPGTGKTHTVKGILNVWHLVHYQRFYESLVSKLVPAQEPADSRRDAMAVRRTAPRPATQTLDPERLSANGRDCHHTLRTSVCSVLLACVASLCC